MKRVEMFPTFLIAGAPRCASRFLHSHLGQHPDILMSILKEPNLFRWPLSKEKLLEDFKQIFVGYDGHKEIGEASTKYFAVPGIAERIKKLAPDMKFIFSLRDPIKRTYSYYYLMVGRGNEHRSFDEVIREGTKEFVIQTSLYYSNLKPFFDHFSSDNIHIIIFEDFVKNTNTGFRDIFEFLNVDSNITLSNLKQKNSLSKVRSRSIDMWNYKWERKISFARKPPVWSKLITQKAFELIRYLNSKPLNPPPIREDQENLLKEIFIPEIEKLETLIGRNLTLWKRQPRIYI